jgi:hypothetical protein
MDDKLQKSIDKINKLHRGEAATAAWQIGEEITKMYEQYPNQKYFFNFLSERTPYSKDLARKYMKIYDLIPLEDIKQAKNILLGHLYALIEINENERKIFLETFKLIENNQYICNQKINLRNYYRVDYIKTLTFLRKESESDYDTPEKIEKYIVDKLIAPAYKENFDKEFTLDNNKGKILSPNSFNLHFLYAYEPGDEQSLVALFCTMFHMIANPEFKFKLGNDTLSFSKIINVRQKFPDAKFECEKYDRKGNYTGETSEIFVEFEYQSRTFTTKHLHHLTPKRYADMIICWENNWDDEKTYAYILSIKELLETGKIVLHR